MMDREDLRPFTLLLETIPAVVRLTDTLRAIAVMDVYTRDGEEPAHEVMRKIARDALDQFPTGGSAPPIERGMDVNSPEAALWSENMRLKSALEWYADKTLYDTEQDCPDILIDGGATARRALLTSGDRTDQSTARLEPET